ncbi:MAG TPA: RidA family protein [Thermohalobaculum sp.]|nr:RidA family protein [Thermohalobaculum sp.]
MTRRLITTGSALEAEFAYSRAVVQGDWCFVAGTTGYDYSNMDMPEGALEQAEAALTTIRLTLEEAGFALDDVVRVRYYLPDAEDRFAIARALQAAFGEVRPAGTMVVTGLIDPKMKVEIEATALRQPR